MCKSFKLWMLVLVIVVFANSANAATSNTDCAEGSTCSSTVNLNDIAKVTCINGKTVESISYRKIYFPGGAEGGDCNLYQGGVGQGSASIACFAQSAYCPTRPSGGEAYNLDCKLTIKCSGSAAGGGGGGASDFIGCFNDQSSRALPSKRGGQETWSSCKSQASGYTYFGMQYPQGDDDPNTAECWAGNSGYDRYGSTSCSRFDSSGHAMGDGWVNAVYRTASSCTASCTGDRCGQSNGCGGTCPNDDVGACGKCGNTACCTPNCAGKNCGDNGCGGSCGTCSSGQTCSSGTCKKNDGQSCSSNSDCLGGFCISNLCRSCAPLLGSCGCCYYDTTECTGGLCKLKNGKTCSLNNQCTSGYCDVTCKDSCRPEVCNNADEDCDGSYDEGAVCGYDLDGDGCGGGPSDFNLINSKSGLSTSGSNGKYDLNADGQINIEDKQLMADNAVASTYFRDSDGDTYGDRLVYTSVCGPAPSGYVSNYDDCDDTSASKSSIACGICGGCSSSQHCDTNNCVSNSKSCQALCSNGLGKLGTKTWANGAWGLCSETACASCNAGYTLYSGTCNANSKSCTATCSSG
ncbi:hypothetical protein HYX09_01815, partial [Candidatus Woesearchaeota archaeon]|nr:hypothetical protein [Candidatus Woesearchaeota archaeon]